MNSTNINHKVLKELLRIRNVEQAFLDLFSQGKLNGTVHTCIGQELSAVAFAGQLKKSDFVFSNHRCHGHFISYTKEWKKLILELMGKREGVCSGVGSSQHLQLYNFYSNGIQGGITPLAAGFALGNKLKKNNDIGIVFIGDGTLGEGVVYETMNFISKKKLPLIIVCENNRYAQSTPIDYNLAGTIEGRAQAFGLEVRVSDTFDDNGEIINEARESIDFVRKTGEPLFHLVNTYRLRAHSKGDDDRSPEEISHHEKRDLLNRFRETDPSYFDQINKQQNEEIWAFINEVMDNEEMALSEYAKFEKPVAKKISFEPYTVTDNRQIQDLNHCFLELLKDEKMIFLGEDILDPYGGAFKVSKGLSNAFPERVIGTSISEGLIAGVANGLALNGFKPYAEFMFGDFTALAFDQFLNHAAKVHNMYNKKVSCPVVFRTPMGGKRGYGPTHSQSIEKHFVGMDMFEILALNQYLDPAKVYKYVHERKHPTLVIENKVDYGKKGSLKLLEGYEMYLSDEDIPNLVIRPSSNSKITTTIITYGGSAEIACENIEKFFYEYDELIQVLILSKIDPLPESFLLETVVEGMSVITFEEGSNRGCIGNNIISFLVQKIQGLKVATVCSLDISIPSVKSLEEKVLVNESLLTEKLKSIQ